MRELASHRRTPPLLSEVRTLADVLLVAVETLLAIAKHSKVPANTFALTDADVWKGAVRAVAAAVVGEVHAERRALWGWVV